MQGFCDYMSPREVERSTSLSRTTIWRMVRRGEFPAPTQLSPGRKGFPAEPVRSWLASRASNKEAV